MKIYTKSGDKGITSLVSGRRINKADIILEAYGTIDELNSFVGLLNCEFNNSHLRNDLTFIQNILFNIGSILAQDNFELKDYPQLTINHIERVELMIDNLTQNLAPLKNFILPGGSKSISLAHICRTICRRAERRVVASSDDENSFTLVIQFLNRLSDYFFTLARYITKEENLKESLWNQKP